MSGICGICLADSRQRVDASVMPPMVAALQGAEGGRGVSERSGAVGMGAQPFPNRVTVTTGLACGGRQFLVSFHGSLYTPTDLTPAGQTRIDVARVAVERYLKEGMTFVGRLRGEFALSLWDEREQTLYLATDRFRMHPLFYYVDDEKLLFASRIRSITAAPLAVRTSLAPEAVVQVVASSFISTPDTIFREVRKLPPAHILTYRGGRVNVSPYWDVNFLRPDSAPASDLTERLTRSLSDAIQVRLTEDRKHSTVGTFLSGGIDSSTVTGLVTRLTGRPTRSFTIGFGEERFNEVSFARIAAQAFQSEHHEYFVTPADVHEAIPRLLEGFDEPFANASSIPTYFCAKLARERGVEVLYAGDGGDELFAGNERYASQRVFDYYDRVPAWFRENVLKPTVFALADATGVNLFVKGKKYIQRASIPYPDRLCSYWLFRMMPMSDIFAPEFLKSLAAGFDPYAAVASHYFKAPATEELDRQLYIDLKLAISDNDLFKVTRMAEANTVAVRFPFLDPQVVDFATVLPASHKMKGRQLRTFFKAAYADLLPVEIRQKTKHGFGLPIPVWLKTDKRLNDLMHDLLLSSTSLQRGLFLRNRIERLIKEHQSDDTSFYGTILWNLMALELWLRRHAK